VLLEVARVSEVGARAPVAWSFMRDVARLSACIPNVSDLETIEADRRYSAVVSDQLGPFKLSLPVEIELQAVDEPHRIQAAVTGNDRRGQARIKGTLGAHIEALESGTRIALSMRMEVLGKLATLGAVPMRRRADEIFSRFAQCLASELAAAQNG
jgi:carbon monoxide dehydrogenase subunit G